MSSDIRPDSSASSQASIRVRTVSTRVPSRSNRIAVGAGSEAGSGVIVERRARCARNRGSRRRPRSPARSTAFGGRRACRGSRASRRREALGRQAVHVRRTRPVERPRRGPVAERLHRHGHRRQVRVDPPVDELPALVEAPAGVARLPERRVGHRRSRPGLASATAHDADASTRSSGSMSWMLSRNTAASKLAGSRPGTAVSRRASPTRNSPDRPCRAGRCR